MLGELVRWHDGVREDLLPLPEAARRVGLKLTELRRRLASAEIVRVAGLELELRATDLVALRRAGAGEKEGR